ncbi:hypothetical protein GCM10029976_032640 [Kribbella albertanoniae]
MVFTIDEEYLDPWVVTVKSLVAAYRRRDSALPQIVVVSQAECGPSIPARIEALNEGLGCRIEFRRAERSIIHPERDSLRLRTLYLRLALPEILADYRRCVYLDSDLIIRDVLHELTALDLGNLLLAAVRDPYNPILLGSEVWPGMRSFGLTEQTQYFNAGVMVMNLERMRSADLFATSQRLIKERYRDLIWHDQDILNALFSERWLPLDPCWNAFPFSVLHRLHRSYASEHLTSLRDLCDIERRARILHYAVKKPWRDGFPDSEVYREFRHYEALPPREPT